MSSLQEGDQVAILGPRRLGMLLILALSEERRKGRSPGIIISAIHRHFDLLELAMKLGADLRVNNRSKDVKADYDIVFDCSGSTSGFLSAITSARREVHLKSTCGAECFGAKQWTAFVVDELCLVGWNWEAPADRSWFKTLDTPRTFHVLCLPSVQLRCKRTLEQIESFFAEGRVKFHVRTPQEALQHTIHLTDVGTDQSDWDSPFPRYDIALVSSLKELDEVIRPDPVRNVGVSVLMSRGRIVLCAEDEASVTTDDLLSTRLLQGLIVRSSRCGSLPSALQTLTENPNLPILLQSSLITHHGLRNDLPSHLDTSLLPTSHKMIISNP